MRDGLLTFDMNKNCPQVVTYYIFLAQTVNKTQKKTLFCKSKVNKPYTTHLKGQSQGK